MKKLVRDNIPEIMVQQGKKPQVCVLYDDAEYDRALLDKLCEEVQEFITAQQNDDAMTEIADILEVLDAICVFRKYDMHDILEKKFIKKQERGGFEKRIVVEFQAHDKET